MMVNVLSYLYHLVMGRMLGPVEYSVLASLFSVLYLVCVIPTSASVAIVKFISSAADKNEVSIIYQAINRFIYKAALGLSLILVIISPLISRFLFTPNIYMVLLISPISYFTLTTLVNQSSAQGLLKFLGSIGPSLVAAFFKLVGGMFFVFLGWKTFGALAGVLIGILLAYVYSVILIKKYLKIIIKPKKYDLKPFFKYSFPSLLQALAFTSLFTIDVILVKHYFSPFEAGIYSSLSTLGKVIYFAASPIAATMFPIVSGRKAKRQAFKHIFLLSLLITFLSSSVIVIFYYFLPEFAINLLYGSKYLSGASYLVWMGIFVAIYSLDFLLVNFSLSINKVGVVIFPMIAALLQIIGLVIWHNTIFQVLQVSIILSISLFVVLLIYLGYNRVKALYAK